MIPSFVPTIFLVDDVLLFGLTLGFLPCFDCGFYFISVFVLLASCRCGCHWLLLGLVDHIVHTDHLVGLDHVDSIVSVVKKLDHS